MWKEVWLECEECEMFFSNQVKGAWNVEENNEYVLCMWYMCNLLVAHCARKLERRHKNVQRLVYLTTLLTLMIGHSSIRKTCRE